MQTLCQTTVGLLVYNYKKPVKAFTVKGCSNKNYLP